MTLTDESTGASKAVLHRLSDAMLWRDRTSVRFIACHSQLPTTTADLNLTPGCDDARLSIHTRRFRPSGFPFT